MASSATRWVRWRTKVKAHVLAAHLSVPPHVARVVGRHWRPRGKRPGRASGGRPCVTRHGRHRTSPALHVTRKTRSRRLAVAPLHHGASRCTMEHHDATGVTIPRQTVKASPHRHKRVLSPGAPADPSDPWNSHAAPVSPRQNGRLSHKNCIETLIGVHNDIYSGRSDRESPGRRHVPKCATGEA